MDQPPALHPPLGFDMSSFDGTAASEEAHHHNEHDNDSGEPHATASVGSSHDNHNHDGSDSHTHTHDRSVSHHHDVSGGNSGVGDEMRVEAANGGNNFSCVNGGGGHTFVGVVEQQLERRTAEGESGGEGGPRVGDSHQAVIPNLAGLSGSSGEFFPPIALHNLLKVSFAVLCHSFFRFQNGFDTLFLMCEFSDGSRVYILR